MNSDYRINESVSDKVVGIPYVLKSRVSSVLSTTVPMKVWMSVDS